MLTYYKDYIYWRDSLGYKNRSYIFGLNNFLKFLTDKKINNPQQINQKIILEWLLQNKHWAAFTKRINLSHVNCFFKYLQRIEVTKNNPTAGIKLKVTKYVPYIYSIKELCEILKQAREYGNDYEGLTFYTMFYIICALGLRLSETLNIRIKDINFNDRTVFIYKTKFGKERLLPFSKQVEQKLQMFLKERIRRYSTVSNEEPLFISSNGQSYSKIYIDTIFRRITKSIGYKQLKPRIHDFRHTFATHLLYKWYSEGKDVLNKLPYLSIYMGHVDISSTQYYLTVFNSLLHEANKKFEHKFGK